MSEEGIKVKKNKPTFQEQLLHICNAKIIDDKDLESVVARAEAKAIKLQNNLVNVPEQKEILIRQRIKLAIENFNAENYQDKKKNKEKIKKLTNIPYYEVYSKDAIHNTTLILEDDTKKFDTHQLVMIVVKMISMSIEAQKKERAKQLKDERIKFDIQQQKLKAER